MEFYVNIFSKMPICSARNVFSLIKLSILSGKVHFKAVRIEKEQTFFQNDCYKNHSKSWRPCKVLVGYAALMMSYIKPLSENLSNPSFNLFWHIIFLQIFNDATRLFCQTIYSENRWALSTTMITLFGRNDTWYFCWKPKLETTTRFLYFHSVSLGKNFCANDAQSTFLATPKCMSIFWFLKLFLKKNFKTYLLHFYKMEAAFL